MEKPSSHNMPQMPQTEADEVVKTFPFQLTYEALGEGV